MVGVKVEHVLILVIVVFVIYHLVGSCSCANGLVGVDGFSVGGIMYQGIGGSISQHDKCNRNYRIGNQPCEENFYKIKSDDNPGFVTYQCKRKIDKCIQENIICDGTNCPTCDSFIAKNMNLKLGSDRIITQPLNCNSILMNASCEKKYIELWEANASNIEWDNGAFSNGYYVRGESSWTSNDNAIRNIRDICYDPMQAQNLKQDLMDRCNKNIEQKIQEIRKVEKKTSDVDIIQEIKGLISDESIEFGVECCGSTKKCTQDQLNKVQENYLKKISCEKYEKYNCRKNETCYGNYNPNGNNGSGSLTPTCKCNLPFKILQDRSCGIPTCPGSTKLGTCPLGKVPTMVDIPGPMGIDVPMCDCR